MMTDLSREDLSQSTAETKNVRWKVRESIRDREVKISKIKSVSRGRKRVKSTEMQREDVI